MSAPTFVCLTNIPTPYRLFLFGRMHERLGELGWKFEVWFMGSSESDRHWSFANSEFKFPHRFLRMRRFRIGSSTLYWNPDIAGLLRDMRPDILLVAGAWIHPTTLLAASCAPERTIFWCESHLGSMRRRGLIAGLARRWALSRFSEFAVPGKSAKEYVEHHSSGAQIHYLPNLVDPAVFHAQVSSGPRAMGTQDQDRRVLLIVARLSEEKGLIPFLKGIEKLGPAHRSKLTVLIAGSGHLKRQLEQRIARYSLDVRLLGHRTESQMTELYAQAHGFCLPSISDPNPISVIEAMWAGLPLLLSSRVGNHPECLQDARNGFLFDSSDPESVASAISRWLALSSEDSTAFGETSRQIARDSFDPDTVVSNFLDELLAGPLSAAELPLESLTAAQ